MVGEGPLRKEVERRVADLPIKDRFRLVGRLEEAYKFLFAADVVTLTSLWEGTPYSLLEGMGWSKPVVATAVNGCTEVVRDGETGFLSPASDTASWADCVARLLGDKSLSEQMGRRGRQHVEARFTTLGMVTKILKIYS
jgi:glycosyltransferase involved in cell wall biosynthesis